MKYCWRWISSGVGWLVHPRRSAGGAAPVLCQWYFIGPLRRNLRKKEKKEKQKKLTGWQKIQLTWLKDKTTRNIHNVLLKVE